MGRRLCLLDPAREEAVVEMVGLRPCLPGPACEEAVVGRRGLAEHLARADSLKCVWDVADLGRLLVLG